jgi:hypothetical protein
MGFWFMMKEPISREDVFSTFENIDSIMSFFQLLAPFLFVGIGLVFIGASVAPLLIFKYGTKYHPVKARLLTSEVIEKFRRGDTMRMMYKPHIEYEYEFNFKQYKSDNLIFLGQSFASSIKQDAIEFQKKYPPGTETIVYVNPKSPEKVYLEVKTPVIFLFVFVGILAILGGAAIAYFG